MNLTEFKFKFMAKYILYVFTDEKCVVVYLHKRIKKGILNI